MMKIVIFSPTSTKLTPSSIKDRPLGGADQALLRMCYSLGELHEVTAYIPLKGMEQVVNNVRFRPFQDLFNTKENCDVFIHYRKAYAIPYTVTAKNKIFYSQDDTDAPTFSGVPENYFDFYDKVVVLSEYHKEKIQSRFKIKSSKIKIIGNGADERDVVEKTPLTFVYASTPFRGLVVLAKLWREIVEQFPEAKLHVFSSMKIYDGELHDQLYFNQLYEKLKTIKGIVYHGSVTQEEVLQHLDKATMLLYPNTFPETYCNVIMESRASRTPFITSNMGALKETGGDAGVYIEGNPYTPEYQKNFIKMLIYYIENKEVFAQLKKQCYPIRTWEDHSLDFQQLVREYEK